MNVSFKGVKNKNIKQLKLRLKIKKLEMYKNSMNLKVLCTYLLYIYLLRRPELRECKYVRK